MELLILQKIKGLIIQDQMRLDAFLNRDEYRDLHVFFIPVSIPGNVIEGKSRYLHDKFKLLPEQKIILYFGAVYQERKIDQLVEAFDKIRDPNLIMVLHGGRVKFPDPGTSPNIRISDQRIEYHQLHLLISSATIGIALYDISWPNTRLTAFSSEKIARYLQAGVPFIAFGNESYWKLKNEFDCCELIWDTTGLADAITTILNNYKYYRSNCFKAYEKYYNITNTIKPLTRFLLQ
jgi:glycosyltransferase involved in cell wall biosynthesis